jgi:hypothetical protein
MSTWNVIKHCYQLSSGELVTDDASKAEIAKAAIASFDENQKYTMNWLPTRKAESDIGVHPLFKKITIDS